MARLDFGYVDQQQGTASGVGAEALFQLGLMYSAGRDVETDLVAAHKWFNLAALRGVEEAKRYRMEIARDLTKAEVARAQRMAREWLAAH
jgi:TPR repeat protein